MRHLRNEKAWSRFVEIYRPVMQGYSLRRGLLPQDAEEIAQLAIVDVVTGFPKGNYERSRGRFRDWLRGIVDHQIADHLERNGRALTALPDRSGTLFLDKLAAARNEHEQLWQAEWHHFVAEALIAIARARFTQKTCDAVERVILNGEPYQKVADSLGMERNALYQALDRVKRRLRSIAKSLDLEI